MILADLIRTFETDQDSGLHKTRYQSRLHSARMCAILIAEHGDEQLADIKARQLLRWYEDWTERGIAMAHGLVGRLRTVVRFGATFLEDPECVRIATALHGMRFAMPKPRTERITAAQVIDLCRMAHRCGLHSVALCQIIQFEAMFRQKDCLGEYVPLSEPGDSDVIFEGRKWLRGVRWDEIDDNLILRHLTSKRQKHIEIDLKLAPMVIEEFQALGSRPTSGPMIVSEATGRPYHAPQFRVLWRKVADLAGVPRAVFNMDSRAGAISEATDAGADLEHVRHAATHSQITMTQRYSRGETEKIAAVQRKRAAHREQSNG